LELDGIETRAVELLRSRLQDGNITALSAERSLNSENHVTVKGTFRDAQGRERKFEVSFQIKEGNPQVVGWSVS